MRNVGDENLGNEILSLKFRKRPTDATRRDKILFVLEWNGKLSRAGAEWKISVCSFV